MAHSNIDARRFFVASLLSRNTEIDTALKKKVASMFNCHVSAIYADCNYFAKNGWHWELTNGFLNKLDQTTDFNLTVIYSPEDLLNERIIYQVDTRLLKYLASNPNEIYALTPRQFEEFVAMF